MLGLRTSIPLFAISILLAVPVGATTSYYAGASAETTFDNALGSLSLLDPLMTFSAGDLASGGLYNASGTGINFLGFDTAFSFNSPEDLAVNAGKLTATASSEVVEITFPAGGIYAFGIHITVTSGTGNWCIDLTQGGCGYSVFNSSPSNVQFFGIVSDAPITAPLYIHYAGGNPTIVFTDFEAYSTPEPQTVLLVGLGLVILGVARRKPRRKS
jgi:hypothetical protein